LTVEDFHGTASVLVFGDAWELNHDVLVQDAPLLIRGSVSGRERDEESPPIFLDSVAPLSALWNSGTLGVEIQLPAEVEDAIPAASDVFRAFPGSASVFVRWQARPDGAEEPEDADTQGGVAVAAPPRRRAAATAAVRLRVRNFQVAPGEALLARLRELFGSASVRLVRSAG
jgi:DNA polymerase-3 subunit alpha